MSLHPFVRRRTPVAALVAFIAAIAVLVSWRGIRLRVPEGDANAVRMPAVDPAPVPPVAGDRREPVAPPTETAMTPAAAAVRGFDAIWADLIATVTPGAPVHEALTSAADERTRIAELVAELLVAVPDVVPAVLVRLHGLPADGREPGPAIAGRLGAVVFDVVLQRLAHDVEAGAPALAATVALLLDAMVTGAGVAGIVADVLADRPYLDASHEGRLLALARSAQGDLQFLAEPVRRLLVTLWGNRERAGDAAPVGDLLAWFGDPDAGVLGAAALERLLADERYRQVAVDRLCRDKRPQEMTQAALQAARTLPAAAAIDVVRALQTGFPEHSLFAAYGWIASTDPAALQADYERCLADGVMPRHRAELVSALATLGQGPGGLRVADLALRSDPDPRVRGTALLAWCNRAPIADAAAALDRAIADPAFDVHYDLDAVVFAVQALAIRPERDVNTIDRVTAFLLVQPALSTVARRVLEDVRRESVPR